MLKARALAQQTSKEVERHLWDCAVGDVELAHQGSGRGAENGDSEVGLLLHRPGSDAPQISPAPSISHRQPEVKHKLQQNSDQQALLQHNDNGKLLIENNLCTSVAFAAATCFGLLSGITTYQAHLKDLCDYRSDSIRQLLSCSVASHSARGGNCQTPCLAQGAMARIMKSNDGL